MKYAVIKFVNGSWVVNAEGMEENEALINFHQVCAALRNEKTVDVHAVVRVVNEKLDYIKEEVIEVIQPKSETPVEPQE